MSQQDHLHTIWERIRDEIRRLRGMNRFRGSEVHLLPRKEIRLPVEARESVLQTAEIVIHLDESESEIWAKKLPDGTRWALKDFDMDLAAFVERLIDECRGEPYLHTKSKKADYRQQFIEQKNESGK